MHNIPNAFLLKKSIMKRAKSIILIHSRMIPRPWDGEFHLAIEKTNKNQMEKMRLKIALPKVIVFRFSSEPLFVSSLNWIFLEYTLRF